MDETCDKIAQSFPKAIRIFDAMRENGGLQYNLAAACATVSQIKPLPLADAAAGTRVPLQLVGS